MILRSVRRSWVLAGLTLLALLVAACSSSNTKSATPTSPPPVPSAFPEPTVNADQIDAPAKGFSVKVPEGWHARTNFATDAGARFPTDAFFAPKGDTDAQPSIAMTCYTPVAGKTLQQYRDDWMAFVTSFTSTNIQTGDATVSGLPAVVFTYSQVLRGETSDPTPVPKDYAIEKQDYILLQEDCRWVITLLTPGGQLETYKPTIASFLAALKFSSRLT